MCEELDGIPNHQVIRFQVIPDIKAAAITCILTATASTNPSEIVFATAVPQSAPSKFITAASIIAVRGVSAFVEIEVAIAFAES